MNQWGAMVEKARERTANTGASLGEIVSCSDESSWQVESIASAGEERSGAAEEVKRSMEEVNRVLQPGGMILLVETQGTGREQPDPPAHMLPYLGYLHQSGFNSTWIRTAYRFESQREAETLTRFFFGEEMVTQIMHDNEITLPECNGIFWKYRP